MKRAIVLLVLIIACVAGFLITKGIFPSLFVSDESMEPEISSGSLMTIKRLNPEDIKLGDTIVYDVPETIREYYHYPPVISHKVVEIRTTPSLGFRTKGNNTGEDPFTVKPSDIRGVAGTRIPYLGLTLKLFQKQAGLIIIISVLALLAFLLYYREIITLIRSRMPFLFIHDIELIKRVSPPELKAVEKKSTTQEPVHPQFDRAAKHLEKPFIPILNNPGLSTDNQKYKKISKETPIINTEKVKPSVPVVKPSLKDNRNREEIPAATPIVDKETEKAPIPVLETALPQAIQEPEEIPAAAQITEKENNKEPVPAALSKATTSKPGQKPGKLTDEAMKAEKELYEALDRLNSILKKYKNQE